MIHLGVFQRDSAHYGVEDMSRKGSRSMNLTSDIALHSGNSGQGIRRVNKKHKNHP